MSPDNVETESTQAIQQRRRAIRLTVLFIVALLGVASPTVAVLLRGGEGSASFSDGQRFQGVVRAAQLELNVGASTVPLVAEAMAPGDLVLGAVELTNTSPLDLRYALRLQPDVAPILHDSLTLRGTIVTGDTSCPTFGQWRAGVQGLVIDITGDEWETDEMALFGDVRPGQDPGDRRLTGNSAETICLSLELDIDVPDSAQGVRSELTFVATAEQADANEG